MIDECQTHNNHDGSWWEHDARGIPLCRVCERCRKEKLSRYRRDVLTDSNYWAPELTEKEDEAIDNDY